MATGKFAGITKKVMIGLLVVLVVIQFIKPAKNTSTGQTADDMNVIYPIPDSVNKILDKACYDCHSNNTRYPWYSSFQPVAWWLNDHINEGKEELNFSEYGKRTLAKRAKKLKKIAKEVEEGEMPLSSYTWIHNEARLTEQEKKIVIDWANNLSQQITAQLPPESK